MNMIEAEHLVKKMCEDLHPLKKSLGPGMDGFAFIIEECMKELKEASLLISNIPQDRVHPGIAHRANEWLKRNAGAK